MYRPPTTDRQSEPQTKTGQSPLRDIPLRDVLLLGTGGGFMTIGQFALITYLAIFLKETQDIPISASASMLVSAQIAGVAGRIL